MDKESEESEELLLRIVVEKSREAVDHINDLVDATMATETNGHAVVAIKKEANGHVTPYQTPKVKRSAASGFVSIAARILIWYSIFITLFRCPSSLDELQGDSSAICRPYLTMRANVAPYVTPAYERFLSPLVDSSKPYLTKLDDQVFQPTLKLGKKSYSEYLAPRVEQAQVFGNQQWEQTVKPHLDTAQSKASEQYSARIAPPLEKVSAAAAPYISASQENVAKVYNEHLIPAYSASKPYAEKAYGFVNGAVLDTGYPYARSLMSSSSNFLNRSLWPQLRILYGENIEPQLLRISERLGRYRDGQNLKFAVEDVDKPDQSTIIEPLQEVPESKSVAAEVEHVRSTASEAAPLVTALSEEEASAKNREKIEKDLETWKEKFLKAADTGAEDLRERIRELSQKQLESQISGVAPALITRLETTITTETSKLQRAINKIVDGLSEESSDEDFDAAEKELSKAVDTAKGNMREPSQKIRTWKQKFIQETNSLVKAASSSTLELLDNVRDLGLQEIGMRWANTDGVTFKDWQKYRDLKKAFGEWRHKVETVATEHTDLKTTIEAAEEVESKCISISGEAAKELFRLKEVGLWKIQAVDNSEDFSTRNTPAKVIWAGKQATRNLRLASIASVLSDKASSASSVVVGTEAGFVEKASSSLSEAVIGTKPGIVERASSSISEAVVGTPQPVHESLASVVSKKVVDLSSKVSETVVNTVVPSISSAAVSGSASVSSIASEVSGSVIGTSQGVVESVASVAHNKAAQAVKHASEAVVGTPSPFTETIIASVASAMRSVASDAPSSASSIASSVSKIFAGAMAQEVIGQLPILEGYVDEDDEVDEDNLTDKLRETADEVQERLAQLGRAIKAAVVSQTTSQGSVASATSIAEEKYSSAVAA